MIVIFFILLTIVGAVHIVFFLRQSKRMARLNNVDSFFSEEKFREKLSGYTYGMALSNLWSDFYRHIKGKNRSVTIKHASVIFFVLIGGVFLNAQYIKMSVELFIPVIFFATIYMLYLRSKKAARVEFELGFSEALSIVNSAVGAGNSLLQGIEQCGLKVDGIVGEEFRVVSQRLEIGEDIERIFMDSYERLFYREYYFFIVAVLISMKGGGEVKEVINRLSKLISDARIMDRRKYAKTAEPRASIKILILIPIGFFFFLRFLSPENFDILLNDPTGRMILYYCIGSELLGLFIVWSMMNKI